MNLLNTLFSPQLPFIFTVRSKIYYDGTQSDCNHSIAEESGFQNVTTVYQNKNMRARSSSQLLCYGAHTLNISDTVPAPIKERTLDLIIGP